MGTGHEAGAVGIAEAVDARGRERAATGGVTLAARLGVTFYSRPGGFDSISKNNEVERQ